MTGDLKSYAENKMGYEPKERRRLHINTRR